MWLHPAKLIGKHCWLQPLSHSHRDGLLGSIQEGELWKLRYTLIPSPGEIDNEINRRLDLQSQGTMLPFTIFCKKTNNIIGSTTLLNADPTNLRVEIGATFLRKSMQRTGVNTDAKLLLLQHAFEEMQCNVVEFRTHFLNRQSRKGIERIGAKLDGILRNHMIMPDKTLRDTCVYSIIRTEWPAVKAHLVWMNDRHY